eukprot:2371735-Heterocapsa_arctica.AAC.1
MGSRIKRPVDFQGTTRKEAKNEMPTDGTFTMKGNNINQEWKHWNESSEKRLSRMKNTTFWLGKERSTVKRDTHLES